MQDGNAQNIIKALDMLKFRLIEKPKVYEDIADKCKKQIAHDINLFSLDKISILMDLYSKDAEYI